MSEAYQVSHFKKWMRDFFSSLGFVANKVLSFDSDGNPIQLAAATSAQINTGTDDVSPVTAAGLRASKVAQGVAAGYKVARGEHTQVAASDTVATGLATVVSIVVSPRTRTVKQLFFNASPGDQDGAPVAGSVLITSQKPTAVNDVTPIDATDFTDAIVVDWIAIGT